MATTHPRRLLTFALTHGILLGASGCGPALDAALTKDRFRHDRYGYEVRSASAQEFLPAGEGWKVDNLQFEDMKTSTGEAKKKLVSKTGADYVVRYFLDYDDDGESDELGEFYTYDLRLVNVRNAGAIWLRTLPLHPDDEQRDLRVLAEQYVAGVAGTHYEVAQLEGALYHVNHANTYATSIQHRASGTLAGQPAYAVTVDVAEVHQLELDPKARGQRVTLVFVRTPFHFEYRQRKLPVLMLVGYSNLVDDYQGGLDALHGFLSHIAIGGVAGTDLKTLEAPAPAAPPTPGPAPSEPAAPTPPPAEAQPQASAR